VYFATVGHVVCIDRVFSAPVVFFAMVTPPRLGCFFATALAGERVFSPRPRICQLLPRREQAFVLQAKPKSAQKMWSKVIADHGAPQDAEK